MKKIFSSYYPLSEDDYSAIWKEGLFAIDTSFLCNLYRLPEQARNDLLDIFSKIPERLWIPHHAALEFFRNRLNIISDQKKKYSEVRKVLEDTRKTFKTGLSSLQLKKRHSSIDSDRMEKELDSLINSFITILSEYENTQIDVPAYVDPILNLMEKLFTDRIGEPPASQKEVDEIYMEGKTRFAKKIPPGYMDLGKANDKEGNHYQFGGVIYERQYGDLLIWKQIIAECKKRKIKSLIFLTDDIKEDWIWEIGEKKIGPRPELRDEILREADITLFHIYNTEQFLRYSNQYFGTKVSEETIQAAKDAVDFWRQNAQHLSINDTSPEEILEEELSDFASFLVNSDEQVTGTTALTNAYGFGLDTYEIRSVEYEKENHQIIFDVEIIISGDSDPEKPFSGDTITVQVSGVMKQRTTGWKIEDYEIESCELNE